MKQLKSYFAMILPVTMLGMPAIAADLTVNIDSVKEASGKLMIALYDEPADFTKVSVKALSEPATVGAMTFTFTNLTPGDYAVMVYQDVNGNGDLDSNLFGLPKEPWGGSLGEKKLFGAPKWSDAVVTVPATGLSIDIRLNH